MNRTALINAIAPTPTAAEAEAHLALAGLAQVWAERDRKRRRLRLFKEAVAAGHPVAFTFSLKCDVDSSFI